MLHAQKYVGVDAKTMIDFSEGAPQRQPIPPLRKLGPAGGRPGLEEAPLQDRWQLGLVRVLLLLPMPAAPL